eukprot:scaffold13983_cov125-Isochrysis_galbana.AAC.10
MQDPTGQTSPSVGSFIEPHRPAPWPSAPPPLAMLPSPASETDPAPPAHSHRDPASRATRRLVWSSVAKPFLCRENQSSRRRPYTLCRGEPIPASGCLLGHASPRSAIALLKRVGRVDVAKVPLVERELTDGPGLAWGAIEHVLELIRIVEDPVA